MTLADLGRDEDAIAVYEELDAGFGGSQEPTGVMLGVATALGGRARNLKRLGRHDEEIEIYDLVVDRYGKSDDREMREEVAGALYSTARTLRDLAPRDDAIVACEHLVQRFGDPQESAEVTKTVTKALQLESRILGQGTGPRRREPRTGRPRDDRRVAQTSYGERPHGYARGRGSSRVHGHDESQHRRVCPMKCVVRGE